MSNGDDELVQLFFCRCPFHLSNLDNFFFFGFINFLSIERRKVYFEKNRGFFSTCSAPVLVPHSHALETFLCFYEDKKKSLFPFQTQISDRFSRVPGSNLDFPQKYLPWRLIVHVVLFERSKTITDVAAILEFWGIGMKKHEFEHFFSM